jgi:hypothetical protein
MSRRWRPSSERSSRTPRSPRAILSRPSPARPLFAWVACVRAGRRPSVGWGCFPARFRLAMWWWGEGNDWDLLRARVGERLPGRGRRVAARSWWAAGHGWLAALSRPFRVSRARVRSAAASAPAAARAGRFVTCFAAGVLGCRARAAHLCETEPKRRVSCCADEASLPLLGCETDTAPRPFHGGLTSTFWRRDVSPVRLRRARAQGERRQRHALRWLWDEDVHDPGAGAQRAWRPCRVTPP